MKITLALIICYINHIGEMAPWMGNKTNNVTNKKVKLREKKEREEEIHHPCERC